MSTPQTYICDTLIGREKKSVTQSTHTFHSLPMVNGTRRGPVVGDERVPGLWLETEGVMWMEMEDGVPGLVMG